MARKTPKFLTTEQADKLIACAETPRDRVIILTGLYLGLRVSEITKLEIRDFDFTGGVCFVRGGKGDKDASLPVPSKLTEELITWIGTRSEGYVFPSPRGGKRLSSRTIQRIVKRAAARAGLPNALEPRAWHPHTLRHTYCSALFRKKVELTAVRDLMRHESLATTNKYAHTDPQHLREYVERL